MMLILDVNVCVFASFKIMFGNRSTGQILDLVQNFYIVLGYFKMVMSMEFFGI